MGRRGADFCCRVDYLASADASGGVEGDLGEVEATGAFRFLECFDEAIAHKEVTTVEVRVTPNVWAVTYGTRQSKNFSQLGLCRIGDFNEGRIGT